MDSPVFRGWPIAKPSRSKILLLSALVSVGVWVVCDHVRISPTKSVGYRLFLNAKLGKAEKIKRCEYVAFDHMVPEGKVIHEMKEVVCLPEDDLLVNNDEAPTYFCNGIMIGRAKKRTPSGKTLDPFRYNGKIPAGKYFVFGTHENSYDSRYYGFIDGAGLTEKLWPVF
jgi:type IV secretory pathway protease TraF